MEYNQTAQSLQTPVMPLPNPHLATLPQVFAQLKDPRHSPNTTYSLSSLLSAVCAALLCNHKNGLATAQWLADQSLSVKAALGFNHPLGRTPHQSTFHRALKHLDVAALEHLLTTYFADLDQPPPDQDQPRQRGSEWIAVDGKCQRGRLPFNKPKALPAICSPLFLSNWGQSKSA